MSTQKIDRKSEKNELNRNFMIDYDENKISGVDFSKSTS